MTGETKDGNQDGENGKQDGETGETKGPTKSGAFDDANIRRGFIRKVYGILTCQLAVTMVSVRLFMLSESFEFS